MAVAAEGVVFPRTKIPTLPRPVDDLLPYFDGPRILFPDGPAPDRTIRAAFVQGPASFMSSVGFIAGPAEDEDLLRFTAMYLRSNLVRYFMVTQLYQLLSDRDRVSLRDIAGFPFYPPEHHPEPERAHVIVSKVAELSRTLEREPPLSRPHLWRAHQAAVEGLIEDYFGLDAPTQAIVDETVRVIVPTSRKYGLSRVFEIARQRVTVPQATAYAQTLKAELEAWRDAHGGEGEFEVDTLLTRPERAGPFGLVRVTLRAGTPAAPPAEHNDRAVYAVLEELKARDLLPLSLQDDLYFVPEAVIVADQSVYLIKPQAERLWLRRQALRDAERIVGATVGRPGSVE